MRDDPRSLTSLVLATHVQDIVFESLSFVGAVGNHYSLVRGGNMSP